jgi:hypothetical protein
MKIESILASNEALGAALALLLAAIIWKNKPFFRDVWTDQDRFWRVIARCGLVSVAALIAWVALADNFRQIAGAPYRFIQLFPSKRVEYGAPSDAVRNVTVALVAVALVFTACLVSRHVGGIGTQFVLGLIGLVGWLPFFIVRQRLDLNLAMGFDGSWSSPVDAAGYILFVLCAWVVDSLVLIMMFSVLLAVVSMPVTLLLEITRLRQPRIRGEAKPYFSALAHRQ